MPRTTLAALLGLTVGLYFGGCSPKITCKQSNCAGCCDDNGECQPGTDVTGCGLGAQQCQYCDKGTQGCFDGFCQMLLPDGGHAGGAGGGSGAGGGTGTGGGSASCNPSNCNGCCDMSGACRGGNTYNACGIHGAACETCPSGQTCINNACAPFQCPTCKDTTGTCQAGNQNGNCGSDGGTCAVCNTGEQCIGGTCVVPSSCSASNCANGCCEGTVCNTPPTDAKCGTGGANCVACSSGFSCTMSGCQAATGGGSGSGGGTGGSGGGGGSSNTCTAGQCDFFCCGGCCDSSNNCQPGDQTSACGVLAGSCKQCSIACTIFGCI